MSQAKTKYPREDAMAVVRELLPVLNPACLPNAATGKPWLVIAGSLRRRKALVGDIEVVYVPAFGPLKDGLFMKEGNLMDAALEGLVLDRVIAPRPNGNGAVSWGKLNKLAVHVASGIPVDFFATTTRDWFSYLVCRTGGKDNNTALAIAAQERGLKWLPYHGGMQVQDTALAGRALDRHDLHTGQVIPIKSEQDVYTFAGRPYLEPHQRP